MNHVVSIFVLKFIYKINLKWDNPENKHFPGRCIRDDVGQGIFHSRSGIPEIEKHVHYTRSSIE
jgi:hypothetical protein